MSREEFMQSVEQDASGCWYWRGDPSRYGTFKGRAAHRVSWELHQGPIPEGLVLLHGCSLHRPDQQDMPGCVNPAHLRPGTPRENALDTVRTERAARALATTSSAGAESEKLSVGVVVKDAKLAAMLKYLAASWEMPATNVFLVACDESGVSDWILEQAFRLLQEQHQGAKAAAEAKAAEEVPK